MEQRDHHDWASETYVDEWVRRQQAEDPIRAERFQLMCDLFPFASERFTTHCSDLFQKDWLPTQFAPFDAAVSSSCLHNLRDFARIRALYREIREHLRTGGIFLNLDLFNAPTAELHRRYDTVMALNAAGFTDVDCFWKDLRRALVGGYA